MWRELKELFELRFHLDYQEAKESRLELKRTICLKYRLGYPLTFNECKIRFRDKGCKHLGKALLFIAKGADRIAELLRSRNRFQKQRHSQLVLVLKE